MITMTSTTAVGIRAPRATPLGNFVTVDGLTILTGSLETGVGQPNTRIGDHSNGVRIGRLDRGDGDEIDSSVTFDNSERPLYGLSPMFTLLAPGPQPPVVQYSIPDQSGAIARAEFSYTFPANSFYDINMDELTYSVAAPAWLTIDPVSSRTVRGTPPSAAVAQSPISVTVVASDGNPTTADVSDTFQLTVTPGDPAPPTNVRAVFGDGSITVFWDPLVEDGGIPVTLFEAQVTRRFDNDTSTCMIDRRPRGLLRVRLPIWRMGLNIAVSVSRHLRTPALLRHERAPLCVTTSSLLPWPPLPPLPPIPRQMRLSPLGALTTSMIETITIPTHSDSTYAYTVDWGDGTTDTYTGTVTATHTYPAEVGPLIPNYVVTIRGDFPRIYFNNGGDKDKIRTIRQWGTNVLEQYGG